MSRRFVRGAAILKAPDVGNGSVLRQRPLTFREKQCLYLLAVGNDNGDIAHELGISVPTVSMHLLNARRKLLARTREQAVAIGVATGVISIALEASS